jgi:nitroreductase/dihydropteridine reductase
MDETTVYIIIGFLVLIIVVLICRLFLSRSSGVEIIKMPVNEKPVCPSFLTNLDWRRAVKTFSPGAVDYEPILRAIQAAPSSFGVQPYRVIMLTNKLLKEDIKPYCFNQAQITECDVLLVFCAIKNVEARMDEYIKATDAEPMREMMMGFLANIPDKIEWSRKQAYIGLGYALAAATELKIASCPIEGFLPDKVAEILATDPNYIPSVFLALGRENVEATAAMRPRFKFPMDNLFHLED